MSPVKISSDLIMSRKDLRTEAPQVGKVSQHYFLLKFPIIVRKYLNTFESGMISGSSSSKRVFNI